MSRSPTLRARRKPHEEIDEGLPQASGGRKEDKDDAGKLTPVIEGFGFKLQWLGDVKDEGVLASEITATTAGDGAALPVLLEQAQANRPEGRVQTRADAKAADSQEVPGRLSGTGITPLIPMRSLGPTEPERLLAGHDGSATIVSREEGTIEGDDQVSEPPVRQGMASIGSEPERQPRKSRGPARHEGGDCPGANCGGASKRTVEGVLGSRRRQPDGVAAICGPSGVVLAGPAALATLLAAAPRREGTRGKMGLSPIAQALRARAEANEPEPTVRVEASGSASRPMPSPSPHRGPQERTEPHEPGRGSGPTRENPTSNHVR